MDNPIDAFGRIQPELDFDDLIELNIESNAYISSVAKDVASEAVTTQQGAQTISLQQAMDNFANALDRSAIAKSTGAPVLINSQQYKGFIAEEYFKHTLKINALAKGIPDWKIGVYTNGTLPDGSVLSGIDEHVDISVWTREHPWSSPMRTVDYQSKIFNDPAKYKRVFNDPKYQDVQHVGGAGQGVNDTVAVKIGKKTIKSETITPQEAILRADQAKAQSTPEYELRQEKLSELNKIHLRKAIGTGALTGCIVTTISEVIDVIKTKDLSFDQFVTSINHIFCGTVEGGVRGGAIAESTQIISKMLGREIASSSLEAIPGMVLANVSVDFAKDLYRCFITKTIDPDDLLCNTVNNAFTSATGFGGAWIAGQIGEQIAGQFSSQAFLQSVSIFASAKATAATGAAIGSSLGPIGAIVGSVVGGLIIGIGSKAIIGTANNDAEQAYVECIAEINSHIEHNDIQKAYYFADRMESLSDFRLSFKDLLPCYNLISDLREYNLHKKAISAIKEQLDDDLTHIDEEKGKALKILEKQHSDRLIQIHSAFVQQKQTMKDEIRDSINSYVTESYMQYLELYEVMQGDIDSLLSELEHKTAIHSSILEVMRYRNELNSEMNTTLKEILSYGSDEELLPFIDKLTWFMNQDTLIIGRQYISFDEALFLINRESTV